QSREYLVDVLDRKGIVGLIAPDGTVGPRPRAVPRLAQSIVLPDEQEIFGLGAARYEHRHGVRFRESAEIVKMAVLPVGVFDVAVAVANRCGRQDRDGVPADDAHELA